MSEVVIALEAFSDPLVAELLPLAQACWNESSVAMADSCAFYGTRDFEIQPDLREYRRLAELGALVILVLRAGGAARGYALGWTYRPMHHQVVTAAMGDTFYVDPAYRAYAGVLIDRFTAELEAREVAIIGWPATQHGYLHRLLVARGFVGNEIVMEKKLCAS